MKINKKNMLNGLVGLMTAGLLLSACKKNGPVDGTDVTGSSTTSGTSPAAAAVAKSGPISVCYVEVNNNNILNVGDNPLKRNKEGKLEETADDDK
jgi:hypothetical protein